MTISFEVLWKNYPKSDPCIDPRTGKPPKGFDNQCAVRLGTALKRSGISFASFHGNRCPVPRSDISMAASAQQLANWLKTRPFEGCPAAESYTGASVFQSIKGRSGIIFLANYWQRAHEQNGPARTGDHIDLWNHSRLTDWFSWVRVNLHFSYDDYFSDYRLASRALFWHLP